MGEIERYRHLKRGTVYEIIGTAELQAMLLQREGAHLVIYRGEDGKLWARNSGEFHDGRFERVASTDMAGAGEMMPEEHRLEDLKQMAAYGGPVVSLGVGEGFYLASCDHCGWVGSSELCGTDSFGDDSDVYCPRCHSSGADCGKVAERLAAPQVAALTNHKTWRSVPIKPTAAMLWAYQDCPYEGAEDKWAAMLAASPAQPPTADKTFTCRFDGVAYSHADLEIAQRAACAIVPLYGTGDHGEQEAAQTGKLWNDHPAVQGALRALHEARLGSATSAALEAIDRFVTDHVGNDETSEGVEVDERAQEAVGVLRTMLAARVRECSAAPDRADIMETIENAADDWQAKGYASALAEVRDMANVGRALMEALPEGYRYMNCPSEIVSDLQNQLSDIKTFGLTYSGFAATEGGDRS